MNDQYEHRLKFMEQKVIVMQREVSEVLAEMSQTIQKIAATYGIAMRTLDDRLSEIEKQLKLDLQNSDKVDRSEEDAK